MFYWSFYLRLHPLSFNPCFYGSYSFTKKADKFYYEQNNKDMSSYCEDHALVIKNLAIKLGICEEVYQEAYKIYDFRNSGKKGYTLKNGKIVKIEG